MEYSQKFPKVSYQYPDGIYISPFDIDMEIILNMINNTDMSSEKDVIVWCKQILNLYDDHRIKYQNNLKNNIRLMYAFFYKILLEIKGNKPYFNVLCKKPFITTMLRKLEEVISYGKIFKKGYNKLYHEFTNILKQIESEEEKSQSNKRKRDLGKNFVKNDNSEELLEKRCRVE